MFSCGEGVALDEEFIVFCKHNRSGLAKGMKYHHNLWSLKSFVLNCDQIVRKRRENMGI